MTTETSFATYAQLAGEAGRASKSPLEAAVFVARQAGTHYPMAVPNRPASRYDNIQLTSLAGEILDGAKLDDSVMSQVHLWSTWRVEAAHAKAENRRRFRGLLWALATLAANAQDPRAETMCGLLVHALDSAWKWAPRDVPAGVVEREELVDVAMLKMDEAS